MSKKLKAPKKNIIASDEIEEEGEEIEEEEKENIENEEDKKEN